MSTTHIATGEDMDQSTTHPGDTTINGIFDRLDALEALFPHGFGFSDWTPRLVSHDANFGNGYVPSSGFFNPDLGSGTAAGSPYAAGAAGRVFQVGKLVVATYEITFGATSSAPHGFPGVGELRVSLPYPCGAHPQAYSTPIGFGHVFNPNVPNTFFGLGPGNFVHYMLHSPSAAVASDVAGLVIGVNRPRPAALAASGLTAPPVTITSIAVSGTTATVTASAHGATAGGQVVVTGNAGTANGVWTVLASPAPTGTTYAVTVPSDTTGGNGGTSAVVGPAHHTNDTAMDETAPGASYSQPVATETRNLLGTLWKADIAAWSTNLFDNMSDGVPWPWSAGCRVLGTAVYEAA